MEADPQSNPASFGIGRILLSSVLLLAIVAGGTAYMWGVPSLPWAEATEGDGGSGVATSEGDNDGDEGNGGGDLRAPAAAAVPVETAIVKRDRLVMQITATGIAEANRLLKLESAAQGTISEIPVREGNVVDADALLVALDDTELLLERKKRRESLVRAYAAFSEKQNFLVEDEPGVETDVAFDQFQEAQQSLLGGELSRLAFERLLEDPKFDRLFSTLTRDQVMAAQDGLMSSTADYETAELQLARARTKAPFGGQIANVEVVVGQRVNAGTELMTLVDANPILVKAEVLESEAGKVYTGRRAEVRFSAYPDRALSGRVEAVSPLVNSERKTLEVTVSLPNPRLDLKPGMFAQIDLVSDIYDDRVIVPSSAVLLRGEDERPLVFVVRDGWVQWVYIVKGRENPQWVEVLDGVEPGDEVVVSGHYSMAHDTPVRVVSPDPDEASGGN